MDEKDARNLPAGDADDEFASELAAIWRETLDLQYERLETLERAAGQLVLEGRIDEADRAAAERAAHTLAGSLGVFGFLDGARAARAAEETLRGPSPPAALALRLSESVVALRRELAQEPAVASGAGRAPGDWLLVLDARTEGAGRIAALASQRGIRARTFSDPGAAAGEIAAHPPTLALLRIHDAATDAAALDLLSTLTAATPPVPAVVVMTSDGLLDRVDAARRGAALFLPGSATEETCVEELASLKSRTGASGRILAVDDDPLMLAFVQRVLAAQGHSVAALGDPLRFQEELDRAAPDLLILDIDMPGVSGLELLRVVRADPRRAGIGVVMLTARADVATVSRAFSWGADDFLVKPVSPAELIVRVRNRLERVRRRRVAADGDALTGLPLRAATEARLRDLLARAGRLGEPLSVALVGLGGLRELAASSGERAVEAAVRAAADALVAAFGGDDVVGRWSGHEFVVTMGGLDRDEALDRIGDVLERLGPAASAGVATSPTDARNAADLLDAARGALENAARSGGGRATGTLRRQTSDPATVDVALVDDDDALASVVTAALETRGYSVRRFSDGGRARAALAGASPEARARVILLDVDLPGLNGLALLRALRDDGVLGRSQVVMLTARSVESEVLEALELGAQDHVAKPFSIAVLLQRMRRILRRPGR